MLSRIYERGEQERGKAHTDVEGLQRDHLFEEGLGGKRAAAVDRRPDGDHRCDERGGRGARESKAPGRYRNQREDEVLEAVLVLEQEVGHHADARQEHGQLGASPPTQAARAAAYETQEERRDQENPRRVTRPPDGPGRHKVAHRYRSRQGQHRAADGRAYGHSEQGTQNDDCDRIAHPIQLASETGAPQQLARGQWSEGVAARDERGTQWRWAEREVDRECGEGDGRPHPAAEDEERDQGDSGRRPEGGDLAVDQGQVQAEVGREPVGKCDGCETQQVQDGWDPVILSG